METLYNFKKIITKPDFPLKAFEREKSRTLLGIQQKQQSPGDIANDVFFAAIYGDHPYAHPQEGTEKSVTKLTVNDIKEFYKKFYKPPKPCCKKQRKFFNIDITGIIFQPQ